MELEAELFPELLVVLRAAREHRQIRVDEDLRVEVGAGRAVAREERDELVDAGHHLLGDAQFREPVVGVVDAPGRSDLRLEAPESDLERPVQESAVVPSGDPQHVGVVGG